MSLVLLLGLCHSSITARPQSGLLHCTQVKFPATALRSAPELQKQLLKHKKSCDWEAASATLWAALDQSPDVLRSVHFNVVITTLASAQPAEWERALLLLEQMPTAGVSADAFSYSAAITACSRGGQTDRALGVFKQCVAEQAGGPNGVVFNAMLSACQRGGAPWRNQLLALFASMSAHGVAPDAWAYSTAIDALAQTGQWERALSLVSDLENAGSTAKPESHCYGAAMRACMRAGRWQSVLNLYERMVELGVDRTTHTLAPTLAACGKDPHALGWRRAHEILGAEMARLREARLAWLKSARGSGAAAGGRGGARGGGSGRGGGRGRATARRPRGRLPDSSLLATGLNDHCYAAAAQAYASGGRWREATDLLNQMRTECVRPNAHVYTAVLSAYGPSRRWRRALELLHGMPRAGVRADAHCVNTALCVVARAGQWQAAAELVRGMHADLGVAPTAVHVTTAVGVLVKAKRLEEASDLIAELLQLDGEDEAVRARDDAAPTTAATRRAMRLDVGLCDVALGLCARLGTGGRARQLVQRLAVDSGGTAQMTERMQRCVAVANGDATRSVVVEEERERAEQV